MRSHISTASWAPLLWHQVLERIQFRLCISIFVYRCVYGTAKSCQQPSSNHRHRLSSLSTLFRLEQVSLSTDELFNTLRPCFPSGCIKSMERLSFLSQRRFITVDMSPATEDVSLPVKFSVTTSASHTSFLALYLACLGLSLGTLMLLEVCTVMGTVGIPR